MAVSIQGTPKSSRSHQRRQAMAAINITPLVDVMLVLLVIFMVTTPLLKAAIPLTLPDSRARPLNHSQRQVTVAISSNGDTYLDGVRLDPASIAGRIASMPSNADGTPPQVVLRADRAISYGNVIAVMGELNHAGVTALSLITSDATVPIQHLAESAATKSPANP